jgi:hypothetical protein
VLLGAASAINCRVTVRCGYTSKAQAASIRVARKLGKERRGNLSRTSNTQIEARRAAPADARSYAVEDGRCLRRQIDALMENVGLSLVWLRVGRVPNLSVLLSR